LELSQATSHNNEGRGDGGGGGAHQPASGASAGLLRPGSASQPADERPATMHAKSRSSEERRGTGAGTGIVAGAVPGTSTATGTGVGAPTTSLSRKTPGWVPVTQSAMGTLTVNANPWGNVYVNGKFVRATPLLRYPLRAGTFTVTVENPKLGRYTTSVRIRPGRDTPVIVDLKPERR